MTMEQKIEKCPNILSTQRGKKTIFTPLFRNGNLDQLKCKRSLSDCSCSSKSLKKRILHHLVCSRSYICYVTFKDIFQMILIEFLFCLLMLQWNYNSKKSSISFLMTMKSVFKIQCSPSAKSEVFQLRQKTRNSLVLTYCLQLYLISVF